MADTKRTTMSASPELAPLDVRLKLRAERAAEEAEARTGFNHADHLRAIGERDRAWAAGGDAPPAGAPAEGWGGGAPNLTGTPGPGVTASRPAPVGKGKSKQQ